MNHGTCEALQARYTHGVLCERPAKYKCTNPVSDDRILVCGMHQKRYAGRGWIITDLEREANMKAESA